MYSIKLLALLGLSSLIIYYAISQITLFFYRRRFKALHRCEPAQTRYPLKDPIFGIDLVVDTIKNAKNMRHLEGTYERYRDWGPTFTSRLPGCPTIFTIDPENIKTILATGFNDFVLSTIRVEAMIPVFGHGIFTSDGAAWKHSRQLLRPMFSKENLANLGVIEEHVQHMFRAIHTAMGDNGTGPNTVDLQEFFFRLTMDTATAFLFGHSVRSQERALVASDSEDARKDQLFVDEYNLTQTEASHNVRLGPLNKLRWSPRANRAKKNVDMWVDGFIDDVFADKEKEKKVLSQEEMDKKPYVFIEELAEMTDDRKVLRDQSLNVLLAGRDTTASLLSNLFWELARHPDVWRELKAEVDELGGEAPSYEELKGLRYLRKCINESLRLHPVVPANTREAIRDTTLPHGGGPDGNAPLFVQRGTQVLYSVFSMHRLHPTFAPNHLSFDPSRWDAISPRWEFLPFNGGPRICLGQQFALTEASYVIVRMLQEFRGIKARDEEPWTEAYTLVVCSKNGTRVGLTRA